MDAYRAVALQLTCRSVNRFSEPADARGAIGSAIARLADAAPQSEHFLRTQRQTIERLAKLGLI